MHKLHTEKTIKTFSGHYIDVFDPNPDHIDIRDIARALSYQPRWSGQTFAFYSVAQHSIAVMSILPYEHKLEGLLHDATEAYLCDIPKPIKRHLPDYVKLEKNLDRAIRAKFGLPEIMTPIVKDADKHQLVVEWETIKHQEPMFEITQKAVEAKFLELFKEHKK